MGRRLFVLLVLAMVVAGCVGPARSQGSYATHAAVSLTSMRSAAAAAVMVTEQAAEDRVTGEMLAVVARESEDHARHIDEAFGTRQPPDEASRRLRARVLPVLNRAGQTLAALRIAAFDGDVASASRHAATLEDVLAELDRIAEEIRR